MTLTNVHECLLQQGAALHKQGSVRKCGYLFKYRPYKFTKTWDLRYFSLTGRVLQYHLSQKEGDSHPRGLVKIEVTSPSCYQMPELKQSTLEVRCMMACSMTAIFWALESVLQIICLELQAWGTCLRQYMPCYHMQWWS